MVASESKVKLSVPYLPLLFPFWLQFFGVDQTKAYKKWGVCGGAQTEAEE